MKLTTISEISRKMNISTRTLRYYEQIGLIESVKKRITLTGPMTKRQSCVYSKSLYCALPLFCLYIGRKPKTTRPIPA